MWDWSKSQAQEDGGMGSEHTPTGRISYKTRISSLKTSRKRSKFSVDVYYINFIKFGPVHRDANWSVVKGIKHILKFIFLVQFSKCKLLWWHSGLGFHLKKLFSKKG
jgi:hypothetical protein